MPDFSGEQVRVPEVGEVPVTASMGIATGMLEEQRFVRSSASSNASGRLASGAFQTVFDAADSALYRAKSSGRDRVEVSAA